MSDIPATACLYGAAPEIIVSDGGSYGPIGMHQCGRCPHRFVPAGTCMHRMEPTRQAGPFGAA